MKQTKTNAMRLLDKAGIAYAAQSYDTADGAIDGVSVAKKTGRDPARVFKTLVCTGASGSVYVFCIPVAAELQLKAAARAAGEKSLGMLPVARLLETTGYVKGGCSPVGMKKQYPTFLHESAFGFETILVSGGKVGLQIELSPIALAGCTKAVQYAEGVEYPS